MDGISGVTSKDGSLYLDGAKTDISTEIMAQQMVRVESLDTQVEDQVSEMKKRNAQLKKYNDIMNMVRTMKGDEIVIEDSSSLPEGMLQDMVDAGILKYRVEVTEENGAKWTWSNDSPVAGLLRDDQGRICGFKGGLLSQYPPGDSRSGLFNYERKGTRTNTGKTFTDKHVVYVNMKEFYKKYLNATHTSIAGKTGTELENAKSANTAVVKSAIDNLNNTSQLDMIRLQGLINKRNQAFEMMSNLLSKAAKARDAIIANMR